MYFSAKTRKELLQNLNPFYDLLIIGGGITGAGTAMAAAKTGLKTLLIDKNDFAYGTSSRSSKMIHGGLRYLQQMNFALVKESLTERELLMKLLPNQVFAQEYVYPVYEYSKNSRFEVKLGMIGYDLLAGSQRIGHHHHWTPDEFAAKEPAINREKLTGGFVYHDCLVDDSRLTLAAIQSAAAAGVECLSYFKLEKLKKQGDNWALKCHDELDNSQEYSFNAAAIINATGPWTDEIRNLAGYKNKVLRPTKGVHLVFKKNRLPLKRSVVIFGEDGRMIFTVPKGDYTYLGTTDTDYNESIDSVFPDNKDRDYLLKAANNAFNDAHLTENDIISAWAGLRPLIGAEGDPSDINRDFEIISDENNFLSIAGGKLTTFRVMGLKIIRELLQKNPKEGVNAPDDNAGSDSPLWGGNILNFPIFLDENIEIYSEKWGLRDKTIERLIRLYGTRFSMIFSNCKKKCHYIASSDIIEEEILYQIQHEMALTLEDVMWRRLSLLLFEDNNGLDIVDEIAKIMAKELKWKRKEKQAHIEKYLKTVKLSFGNGHNE